MGLNQYNYTRKEETEVVRKQFENVRHIFQENAIGEDGDPIVCQFHDIFGTYDSDHHNCLGCNLSESVDTIVEFLDTCQLYKTIRTAYTQYLTSLYLLVERIDTLFNLINLNESYRTANFKVLLEVRRWANFIKHPKAFLLTHHATYTFVGSPKLDQLRHNANAIIEQSFIAKYYSNNDHNDKLLAELENKENVLVIFPDIERLTTDMCEAMQRCVSVLRNNEVYRELLRDRTTFLDYWLTHAIVNGA